ncbi:hypothetical protein DFR33_108197 [Bradymonas sediminis]|nr:hypothetical protein DFR33_108197 [Bradymonas sediminis]
MLVLGAFASSAACTEPREQLGSCVSDSECPTDRVCGDEGVCVAPDDEPDAGDVDNNDPDAGDVDNNDPDGGSDTLCPAPTITPAGAQNDSSSASALPGSTIRLDGRRDDDAVVTYQWRFVDFPYSETIAELEPKLVAHANGTADFKAEALGLYTVELEVKDANGASVCPPTTAQVLVETDDQIYVELVWETPGQTDKDASGPDLELHYKHPNGTWAQWDPPLDIFWYVPTADWGIPGDSSDDPVMRRFIDHGPGPEAIAHKKADPLVYSVGVYSYDDKDFGPSFATVRVYLDGELADEVPNIEMPETNHFYEVLTIDAGQQTTEYLDNHYEDFLEM